jgi:hypothetical protein
LIESWCAAFIGIDIETVPVVGFTVVSAPSIEYDVTLSPEPEALAEMPGTETCAVELLLYHWVLTAAPVTERRNWWVYPKESDDEAWTVPWVFSVYHRSVEEEPVRVWGTE